MGVMHIPGHSHQAPREVALEEIEAVLGECHLCPALPVAPQHRVWRGKPPRSRDVYWRGTGP